jgi:hypothetical protein
MWERGERRERGLNAVGKELFQNKNQFTTVVTLNRSKLFFGLNRYNGLRIVIAVGSIPESL